MSRVPAAKAECWLGVQKGDDRRTAPQRAKRAGSGRSRDHPLHPPGTPMYILGTGLRSNKPAGKAGSGQEVMMRIVHVGCRSLALAVADKVIARAKQDDVP